MKLCFFSVFLSIWTFLLRASFACAENGTVIGLDHEELSTVLPKGLSDFTANKDIATGLVYISGGCDAPNGNVFVDGEFICPNISKSLYSFDAKTETFDMSLPDMPVTRYRHAAVLIDGTLWIHGGRHVNDTVISNVDVYNVEKKKWSTFIVSATEADQYHGISDHAAFPNHETKHGYFCGGYTPFYEARSNCFSIDTTESLANTTNLVVVNRASLSVRRGDISIVSDSVGAIVSGGFSDTNKWCEPYGLTEEYNFDSDNWIEIDEMNVPRGDKALVELDGSLYALGGERELPNICNLTGEQGPEQKRITVTDVEVYDRSVKQWIVISELPEYRFRFAAVAFDELKKIYAFGGQLTYNESCQCLATTNEVTVYTEKYDTSSSGNDGGAKPASAAENIGPTVSAKLATVVATLLFVTL